MSERDPLTKIIADAIEEWEGIQDPSAHLPEYIARNVKYAFLLGEKSEPKPEPDIRYLSFSYSYRVFSQESTHYVYDEFLEWARYEDPEKDFDPAHVVEYFRQMRGNATLSEVMTGSDWPDFKVEELFKD